MSYPTFFVRFPATRDVPWVNLILLAIAAALAFVGLRRAFASGSTRRRKIIASIAATLTVVVIFFFVAGFMIYPRRMPASHGAPQIGQRAPDFRLPDTNNQPVALSQLLTQPIDGKPSKGVLIVFYRGYWWPSCNSELRSIESKISQIRAAGINPVAISVDSPDVSRDFARKAGFTFPVLSDPNLEAIRRYDLVHAGQGVNGSDVARPAEFLVAPDGTVRWVNLTENYWVRARPEQILEAAKSLN
jgi:peroxiredoxin